jgi:hypothetical protein
MLTLRQEQLDAFAQSARQAFIDRMSAHLRSGFFPSIAGLDDAALVEFIEHGMAAAPRYGMEAEEHVRYYIESMAIYGKALDTAPETAWAGRILRDPQLSGVEKVVRMNAYELFELRMPA